MAIPTNVIEHFKLATESLSVFDSKNFRLNIDHLMSKKDFEKCRPFKALHIRERSQIVTDGFENGKENKEDKEKEGVVLDWKRSGVSLTPSMWHKKLVEVANKEKKRFEKQNENNSGEEEEEGETIVLDCRNSYESDVGKFENAIALNTTFFKDSFAVLDELLKNKNKKNTQILTYCTGGIRCVKINAYLEQKLGFFCFF
jgi:predicted sulfurtransferase